MADGPSNPAEIAKMVFRWSGERPHHAVPELTKDELFDEDLSETTKGELSKASAWGRSC